MQASTAEAYSVASAQEDAILERIDRDRMLAALRIGRMDRELALLAVDGYSLHEIAIYMAERYGWESSNGDPLWDRAVRYRLKRLMTYMTTAAQAHADHAEPPPPYKPLPKVRREPNDVAMTPAERVIRIGTGYAVVDIASAGHRPAIASTHDSLAEAIAARDATRDARRTAWVLLPPGSPRPRPRSGYYGVYGKGNRYTANHAGKHIGQFGTAEDAARAYDAAVRANQRLGNSVHLNFPDDQ